MSFATRDVTWSVEGRVILNGISLTAPEGGVTGILGPNGSGKSSLSFPTAEPGFSRTWTFGASPAENEPSRLRSWNRSRRPMWC